ncbi:MAG: hypothetical protein AAGF95_09480 [Chloroflexota bacterium]
MAIPKDIPLPDLLEQLIHEGTWQHPGDDVLQHIAPYITDPLIFLPTREMIDLESAQLMEPDEIENTLFFIYRSPSVNEPRNLPWTHAELSINIAINQRIGDDVALALDYRIDPKDPRVIATDWHDETAGDHWREVLP